MAIVIPAEQYLSINLASPLEPPVVSEERYSDLRNPDVYSKATGLVVKAGDLLQKIPLPEGSSFPSYIPLKVLAQSAKDKEISLKILDTTFKIKFMLFGTKNLLIKTLLHLKDYSITNPVTEEHFEVKDYARMIYLSSKNQIEPPIPYEKIFTEGSKAWPSTTKTCIEERFEMGQCLGKGGEGTVLEVKEKDKTKALKISRHCHACWGYFIPTIKYVLEKELTPHLTRVEDVFQVSCEEGLFGESQRGDSLKYRCYVMEKLDGDLQNYMSKADQIQIQVFEVQQASLLHLLEQFKIKIDDHKFRNILVKKLDDTDLYRGEKMIQYDWWQYTIGEYVFYVPRPEVLIKFADYDGWRSNIFSWRKKEKDTWRGSLKSPEKLSALFSKPDVDESKILKINS